MYKCTKAQVTYLQIQVRLTIFGLDEICKVNAFSTLVDFLTHCDVVSVATK